MNVVVIIIFILLRQLIRSSMINACPSIYKMIDENHSFCLPKRSLSSQPPNPDEIALILRMHNKERSLVESLDMQKMYWNADIAEVAQRYAEYCNFDHDTSYQRQAPRIPVFTGQNLAMGQTNWQSAIQDWADEKHDFVFGQKPTSAVVGHYTQMVKSTAVLIGCGLAICPKHTHSQQPKDWPHYVCNYVTGQLGDYKPYQPSSSSIPESERLHDCHGILCLYGGSLNLQTCECDCATFASGRHCEKLDCSSLTDSCLYGTDTKVCKQFANVPDECPKFCGLCERYDAIQNYYESSSFESSTTRLISFNFLFIHCSTMIMCRSLFLKE